MKIKELVEKYWTTLELSGEASSEGYEYKAYEDGVREGLRLAIRLLKQLRPQMGGLGGPIYILKEWLDGKADIPEEVSAGE